MTKKVQKFWFSKWGRNFLNVGQAILATLRPGNSHEMISNEVIIVSYDTILPSGYLTCIMGYTIDYFCPNLVQKGPKLLKILNDWLYIVGILVNCDDTIR